MTFLILILCPFVSRSQQKPQLLILDSKIDADQLKPKFEIHRKNTHKSSLPDKTKRDFVLGNQSKTATWEEYKKDAFFVDLTNLNDSELRKKYPEFSKEEFVTMKRKLK